jgi:hypothetical protein
MKTSWKFDKELGLMQVQDTLKTNETWIFI